MGMTANAELHKARDGQGLRGFSNLFGKESRAWWATHRWWVNALLWTGVLCGLTAIMLFLPNEEILEASAAEVALAGGETAYTLWIGLNVFFEFGVSMLAIGTVVLSQDLIIGERHSGVAEWLLSKPVRRHAYIWAKVTANALPVLLLLVALPSTVTYGIISLRMGAPFPMAPFLSGVGIMALNTWFYLTLTLMLGTLFNSRGPILGIALGSILGGGLLGGFIEPLFWITPWMLPKVAWLTATGQALAPEMRLSALVATAVWSVAFIVVALIKFEKTEY
jgi:ABC-2 type transport system permease protein